MAMSESQVLGLELETVDEHVPVRGHQPRDAVARFEAHHRRAVVGLRRGVEDRGDRGGGDVARSAVGSDRAQEGFAVAAAAARVREAKAAGLYYNRETGPRCAAILAERWGYPDAREGADPAADFATVRAFGSHCYSAGRVLDARQRREALREAANKLHVGPIAGRLVTARGENITSARIVRIEHTGEVVEIIGKRGRADVTWKPNALGALEAIEGGRKWAEKHGRQPAGASIFDAAA